ncbi:MAG: VanZ family protein [Candidatus Marinimicrobia bacterium]|nr:VanZ family protein [Candidatus Neomarinimicrobiota bacterium]
MNPERRSFFYFLCTALYAAVLLIVLLLPSESMPEHKVFSADKIWHLLSYSLLTMGLMFSFREGGWKRGYNRRWSLVIALAHAGISEVLQNFSPGRSADLGDWIANCAGIGIALLALRFFPDFF